MSANRELICAEKDGTLSFGDYTREVKSKVEDFEHDGDLYKVKTFFEITKLERNGMFVYESVPGTAVRNFRVSDRVVSFLVEGSKGANITLQLEDDTEYEILENGIVVGSNKTNMSGKLSLFVELSEGESVEVQVVKR